MSVLQTIAESSSGSRGDLGQSPLPICVIVLTHNEELNLAECLESVQGWVREIYVVDSGSTDDSRTLARNHGAHVIYHPFETHASQWGWALETLAIDSPWVLGLDADQRVTPELRKQLIELFELGVTEDVSGFYISRRQVFRGRWIRHGGYYPKYILKLFRRDRVRFDPHDLVDHHFHVVGQTLELAGDLVEENRKEMDISFWLQKHIGYAPRLAREELRRRSSTAGDFVTPSLLGSPDQRVAWMKRLWRHLPLYVRPALYFFYRYILRLGFMDGKEGFLFHFLQGFWYRVLVDIYLDEFSGSDARTGSPRSTK